MTMLVRSQLTTEDQETMHAKITSTIPLKHTVATYNSSPLKTSTLQQNHQVQITTERGDFLFVAADHFGALQTSRATSGLVVRERESEGSQLA